MRPRRRILFALAFIAVALLPGCQTAPRNSLATHNSAKWEDAIAAYEAQDETNRPAPGCIVFTGSSYIRRWTNLVADFPGLPVVNRGFGGCQLADVHHYADRIVIPYAPRQVVIYAGGNDINAKKPPEMVFGDFVALMKNFAPRCRRRNWCSSPVRPARNAGRRRRKSAT